MSVSVPSFSVTADHNRSLALAWLVSAFIVLHLVAVVLLPDALDRFMLGDRANDRVIKLSELFAANGWDAAMAVLFRQGAPGDYLIFAPAWLVGGAYAVLLQNIALFAVGIVVLHAMVTTWFGPRMAIYVAAIYAVLPSVLFHPHAFVSEAVCNPALIVATWLFLEAFRLPADRLRYLAMAATCLAVLCFVRHIYLLLPFGLAAIVLLARDWQPGERLRGVGVLLTIGFSLVLIWSAFAATVGRGYQEGPSVGGLGSNLFLRAQRMSAMSGFRLPDSIAERKHTVGTEIDTLTPREFVSLVAAYPGTYAKTVLSDAANLIGNPGVAMTFGRFMGFFDLGERHYRDLNKWREIREQKGMLALVRELWRTSPTGLVMNAIGVVVWLGVLVLAAVGGLVIAFDAIRPWYLRAVVCLLPLYFIGLTSIMAGYTRWDHRSPIEFLIVLAATIGASCLARRWQDRRAVAALRRT